MTIAAARPHTDAVKAALEETGLLVGRGVQPTGSGWQGEPGASDHKAYVVLYPSAGGTDSEVLADPHEYLDYRVQVTCVGATQDATERTADLVKARLVGQIITGVQGRAVFPFQLDLDRPAARDDQVSPPLHYIVLQLFARSGPA